MGVPAFYRWLSEKYPKIVQDVVEERVGLTNGNVRIPVDWSQPNPNSVEIDNLYIDMNGIIHPCSHPEHGPQPACVEEMYENVVRYVDRLVQVVRPRSLLYLAIDGVAPRAKMNQQRSRRFKSAQEVREQGEIEEHIRSELQRQGHFTPPTKKPWDSNVITPGTTFMLHLADYVRFYVRKRLSQDANWKHLKVIFSDASIPGEGEHKIMSHIRLQRSQPGYNPNLVHCLHGLDADLIMLALATHEAHFYILREQVLFGRKSMEVMEQRQLESGYKEQQALLDSRVGPDAMALPENSFKPLQRISIPILREYLANEFASVLRQAPPPPHRLPFPPSLERLIDDVVFLCFFVGNDFLPHLPSLDIRDGALDFLFNVYKRLLPSMGGYITNHGGKVNLSRVDIILAQVGSIEDLVFGLKYENEQRQAQRRQELKKQRRGKNGAPPLPPPVVSDAPPPKVLGRAARILEKRRQEASQQQQQQQQFQEEEPVVALQRAHQAKEERRKMLKQSHQIVPALSQNLQAAMELKKSLGGGGGGGVTKKEKEETAQVVKEKEANKEGEAKEVEEHDDKDNGTKMEVVEAAGDKEEEEAEFVGEDVVGVAAAGTKRKAESLDVNEEEEALVEEAVVAGDVVEEEEVVVEVDADDGDDDEEDEEDATSVEEYTDEQIAAAAKQFKERVKAAKDKQLDEYAKNVEDKVRLHEAGWKDRYYTDKCKADDVANHGGREHLFRSYVMGLCWVMKYYYDGCPSWKWYYPFHYAPFASDLKNIERFEKDCNSFELNDPFQPVEQLMAVLPEDSAHAIPKASRWLMSDPESPIIDFYPKEVPCDPNGKAMPWLWVVLLPFIDEDRLLAAMKPTMAKWTKKELLCNARGLDDGYLYVNSSNALTPKLEVVLESDNKSDGAKTKVRLSGAGFTGSIRLPLSNEVYPVDDNTAIPPPSSSVSIDRASHDGLFGDAIDPNAAVCVAFTEPAKLSHKSILLPGAVVPPPTLLPQDKVIRRPRLNRGGGTIANMGGGSSSSGGQSHQQGYGSMNISSYERDLAQRQGRGAQMYQTGNRAWGAMEPTPKRHRGPDGTYPQQQPPYQPNPFAQPPPPPAHNYGSNRPPWQNQQAGGYRGGGGGGHPGPAPQGHAAPPYQQWPVPPPRQQPHCGPPQQPSGYPPQRGQGQYQGARYPHPNNPRPPPPPPRLQPPYGGGQQQQPHRYPPQQQPTGYSFHRAGQQPNPQQQQQQPSTTSRVNPNVMNNLRSQLANTLEQNNRRKRANGRS